MHINNEYVRRGEIDVKGFFTPKDVTDEVAKLIKGVPANVKVFHKTVALGGAPNTHIGAHCSKPYKCEFTDYCWKHIPDYSIYDLANVSKKNIADLTKLGVLKIQDIPHDFELTPSQPIQASG